MSAGMAKLVRADFRKEFRRVVEAIDARNIVESIATVVFSWLFYCGCRRRHEPRGMQWIVIGVVFSWLPFVSEVASRWIAG